MNWIKRLFGHKEKEPLRGDLTSGDMRENPVDNPFDLREDGSIHEGDPAWRVMMEAIESGHPIIGNQRADGTWDVREVRDDEGS